MKNTAVAIGFLTCLLFTGCQTIAVKQDARPIRILFDETAVSRCQYKGEIIGSEGHWYNAWLIANNVLTQAAINDLRNQALELGADTVFIPKVASLFKTSVTILGQAFQCQK